MPTSIFSSRILSPAEGRWEQGGMKLKELMLKQTSRPAPLFRQRSADSQNFASRFNHEPEFRNTQEKTIGSIRLAPHTMNLTSLGTLSLNMFESS